MSSIDKGKTSFVISLARVISLSANDNAGLRSRDSLFSLETMADTTGIPIVTTKPKKRKIVGRNRDLLQKERLSSHEVGESCNCTRLKCFENTTSDERNALVLHFNSLPHKDQQDSLLATFIEVNRVKQRRPRRDEDVATLHDHSYQYYVRISRAGKSERVPVCIKAFVSIFGITRSRVERIRSALAKSGLPPTDGRGKHTNRPHAFTPDKQNRITEHIQSFRGRHSHYSLKDTRKLYLPEELNVTKMHQLFMEKYPDENISYESYRKVFTEKFNIGFGYPRKDTCSTCDEYNIQLQESHANKEEVTRILHEKELHLRKAQVFYDRKSSAKKASKSSSTQAAIAFDFQKNLSCPNISTNDVYYRRQLSLFTFNIHNLATDEAFLYFYNETVAKKGGDDVSSMLYDFFCNILAPEVINLELFCDSCAGQNKNWTLLRFLHYMVHHKKRFDCIKISFPIRGHSYMECDRDMACVNMKARAEVPDDWLKVYREARQKPTPFCVVIRTGEQFFMLSNMLKPLYRATCPVPTRPLREVIFKREHPRMMLYRDSWHGQLSSAIMSKPMGKKKTLAPMSDNMKALYCERLPISQAKFDDLQVLKRFCSLESQKFFDELPTAETGQTADSD